MVIVFDLDDTLFEELSFVRSGIKAVALFLEPILKLSKEQIYLEIEFELNRARDQLFNRYLESKGIRKKVLIKKCVSVYRSHIPEIELSKEARNCLVRFQSHPLYVVTDGNHWVQRNKFKVLGLSSLVKRGFFTYSHGKHRSKPSPYCFQRICAIEHVRPDQVAYIADNPNKDFVGLKPLGFHTIRVLTGPFASLIVEEAKDAEKTIDSLDELTDALINFRKDKK